MQQIELPRLIMRVRCNWGPKSNDGVQACQEDESLAPDLVTPVSICGALLRGWPTAERDGEIEEEQLSSLVVSAEREERGDKSGWAISHATSPQALCHRCIHFRLSL